MTKTSEGDWETTVNLHPGRVVYLFDVDGAMWLDPHDDGRVPNGWGSEYSVREVQDRAASLSVPRDGTSGSLLECEKQAIPEGVVLRLSGEVDLVTAPLLFSTLKTLAEDGHNVIVDLSGLPYIDSSGLQALVEVSHLFLGRAQQLVLSGPTGVVRRTIDITQIDDVMPVFPSVEAAVKSCRGARAPRTETNTSQPKPC